RNLLQRSASTAHGSAAREYQCVHAQLVQADSSLARLLPERLIDFSWKPTKRILNSRLCRHLSAYSVSDQCLHAIYGLLHGDRFQRRLKCPRPKQELDDIPFVRLQPVELDR